MDQGSTSIITLVVAIFTLITAAVTLCKSWLDLKKLKASVNQIRVVANTREMKEALVKPLEGLWNIAGTFGKFQGIDAKHFSSGYASFLWDDAHDRYEVIYSYSVSQEHNATPCVTAICHGYAVLEQCGTSHHIILQMQIKNITSAEDIAPPQSTNFTLEASNIDLSKTARELAFSFQTDITNGTIFLSVSRPWFEFHRQINAACLARCVYLTICRRFLVGRSV